MKPRFSRMGERLTRRTGIQDLMDDLGTALSDNPAMRMMGGNPARIPEVEATWRRRMGELMADADVFDRMLVHYDTPKGRSSFIEQLSGFFRETYGWEVTPEHIAVTNGSQNGFFFLFNLLAGESGQGDPRRILLPLSPEYIGYADQGLQEDLFVSRKPEIEHVDDHRFKYHVDFDALHIDETIAGICVSRPTNPTGNVLSDAEVSGLAALAEQHGIPLLIDNAYGAPFPDILFTEVTPIWNENIVLSFSLSKLGLPGTRTGIVVAHPEIIRALCAVNSVVSLATGNIGQAIVEPMFASGEVLRLSREIIKPFYAARSRLAQDWIAESFDPGLDYHVHVSEGALFLWLWFRDLPITTEALYRRLKERDVLIVPGRFFFYGMEEDWRHRDECIRLNYSQDESVVREGIRILADEVKRAYAEAPIEV